VEYILAFIGLTVFAIIFLILYLFKGRQERQVHKFFAINNFTETNDYQKELPLISDSKNRICREINLSTVNLNQATIHWCEYRVYTNEYSFPRRLYIGYSIITFPKQMVTSDLADRISNMIDQTDERLRGNILQRIKKDSQRPTKVIILPNGDLATFWASRRTVEDAQFKLDWIKQNI
jgi:hypothetical protein